MKKKKFYRVLAAILAAILCPTIEAISQTPADTVKTKAIVPIEVVDVNYEIVKVEKGFQKMETSIAPDKRFFTIDSSFRNYKTFLEKEAREFRAFNPYNLSKFFLENSYRLWEGFYQKLNGWQTEINNRIKVIQNNITELEKTISIWNLTLQSEYLSNEPEELKARIKNVISQATKYRNEYQKIKRQHIILEDEIVEMSSFCNNLIEEINMLQENKRDSLFIASELPMWKVKITASDVTPLNTKMNKFSHENEKTLRNYFQTQELNGFWVWAIIIIVFFLYLRHSYLKRNFDDTVPGHKNIIRIFKGFPTLTIISLVLVSFHLLYPYYPLLLNHILTLILLISMRYILSNFIDREDKSYITKLIILLVINDLEIVFWYFGDIARYYILLETVAGMLLMVNYIKPAYWKDFTLRNPIKKVTWLLSIFTCSFYLFAFVSNFFGYLDLAVLFAKVGIHVPEFTVILFGLYKIVIALILAISALGRTSKGNIKILNWDNIESRSIQIANILAIFYWFYSLTVSFEVSRAFFASLTDFLIQERSIGTLQITIWSILAMILILMITYLITGFLKIAIENIWLKRTSLPRGIPAAISVTIRYFLILLGFMFALSAAGIELGKFSLLAGALGVGIGFGLQNIVNNFISGLILIYERPLNVGDTIEVENLLGQVNHIGIRSSHVRTYDGAEVVVPNGNLISNQLINWTLSDNRRRIEIKVGVSYGSDPNVVVKLLEKVANENEDVLKDPAPWALFEGFGDSSLNFRLLFWVPYDIGIGTKSSVAIGIYNIFKENNIEIPFPQLDLHMKNDPKK